MAVLKFVVYIVEVFRMPATLRRRRQNLRQPGVTTGRVYPGDMIKPHEYA